MKLFFKIFGITLVVILILLITLPYFFRAQIVARVKEEINKNINAQVDFRDYSLSLIRSFPYLSLRLDDLSVVGKEPFMGDTLAWIPSFGLTFDLMSVFRGNAYSVRKISLKDPFINLLVEKDGTANWDITIPSEEPATTTETESSGFVVKLKDVTVTNARIIYDDKSLDTYVLLEELDHRLSGDFTMDFTTLETYTIAKRMSVDYEGFRYINKAETELEAAIDADLNKYLFTLKDNHLRLNRFYINLDGSVLMMDNGDYDLDLAFNSRKSDFKSFLSLVPAVYLKDFEDVKVTGNLLFDGKVKGIYSDNGYPGLDINFNVENGRVQYPDLPKSIDDINILTNISYPGGGDFDKLVVDIPKFRFNMAGNPFSIALLLRTPMSDPQIKGEANGMLDLSQVREVYPLEQGDELSGKLTANLAFEGKMSSIEQEKYNEFIAMGSLDIEGMKYKTSAVKEVVQIEKARLVFSPAFVSLDAFRMNLGRNDFSATGRIENFIPYALSDGILTGKLQMSSNYLNITDLMPSDSGEQTTTDTTTMSVIEVPGNIDFTLNSSFRQLIYNNIDMKNVNGTLGIRDKTIRLQNLGMEILDGTMNLSGLYDTREPEKPAVELSIGIKNVDIRETYTTFGMMKKIAPIAEKTNGKLSLGFEMKTALDNTMMPVYETMSGKGNLKTSPVVVENVNTLDKIADALKMADLKRLSLAPVDLTFEFNDGKVNIRPFDIKYQDIKANIGGWTAFDQTIGYDMKLSIPRKKFGGAANAVLDNLVAEANKLGTNFSVGDIIDIAIQIGGTLTDPQIRSGLGQVAGNLADDLKKKALEELEKQKQKLEEEARKELDKKKQQAMQEAARILDDADKQAKKIMEEAQKQADAINKTAQESAQQAKKEAENQAKKLMDEAKKKGPIAEMAAKKSTEALVKEANKKADQGVAEAKKKSDDILKAAQQQADKIKLEAKTKSDKTLEGINY